MVFKPFESRAEKVASYRWHNQLLKLVLGMTFASEVIADRPSVHDAAA